MVAAVYLVIGLTLGELSGSASTNTRMLLWRRLAWLVSGAVFVAHIAYGYFRLGHSPRTTALHASIAAALGAGGLAAAANIHEWRYTANYRPSMAIALIAWPLITAIPAFVVAITIGTVLNSRYRRT